MAKYTSTQLMSLDIVVPNVTVPVVDENQEVEYNSVQQLLEAAAQKIGRLGKHFKTYLIRIENGHKLFW